jgi:O-acetyl-ADP-ribose deacetylase (regulator of RNase III)
MITFTTGNLLEAHVEALVNTVNTVGVMGKGIALMFKGDFPENFKAYQAACRRREVRVGRMFVTERNELIGPSGLSISRPRNIGATHLRSNGLKRACRT